MKIKTVECKKKDNNNNSTVVWLNRLRELGFQNATNCGYPRQQIYGLTVYELMVKEWKCSAIVARQENINKQIKCNCRW